MADMYICPNAKECRPARYCDGKEPHKRMYGCNQWYCPNSGEIVSCIPSPSPSEPGIPHIRVPRTATTNLVVSQVDEPAPQPKPQPLEGQIRDLLDLYSASYIPDKLLDEVTQEIMAAIAASQQAEAAAMREALQDAREELCYFRDGYNKNSRTLAAIAKIDTVLRPRGALAGRC